MNPPSCEKALCLQDNIAACIHGRRAIFLNISTSRYFALPDTANEAFIALSRGYEPSAPGKLALASLDILVPCSDSRKPPLISAIPAPNTQLVRTTLAGGITLQLLALTAQIRAMFRLRCFSLERILRDVASKRKGVANADRGNRQRDDLWLQIASAFRSTRNLRPRSGHCLTSSLAFQDLALRCGLDAQLIFGVQSAPFAAHCWVQNGTQLVNDELEYVSSFTPILSV